MEPRRCLITAGSRGIGAARVERAHAAYLLSFVNVNLNS